MTMPQTIRSSRIENGVTMDPDLIYIGEAVRLLGGMDPRTFRKYVKNGVFLQVDEDAHGHALYSKKQVLSVKPRAVKERKKGYPIIPK